MDSKFGLIGGGWQDYHDKHIQPVLNELDQQIDDIHNNGAVGQLTRMQVMNDLSTDAGATNMFGTNSPGSRAWLAMRGAIQPENTALLNLSGPAGSRGNIAIAPTLDDVARMAPFNLRDSDLAAIRKRSDIQQGIQSAVSTLVGPVAEWLLPELGVTEEAANVIGKAVDAYDKVQELTEPSEKEKLDQAYQQALFNQLNGIMIQRSLSASTPPVARGLIP